MEAIRSFTKIAARSDRRYTCMNCKLRIEAGSSVGRATDVLFVHVINDHNGSYSWQYLGKQRMPEETEPESVNHSKV